MRQRRQLETIAGRVNTDGSIASGDGFIVSGGGSATKTFYFRDGFRLITATAVIESNAGFLLTQAITDRSFQVVTVNPANTLNTPFPLSFIAVGYQV